MRFWQNETEGQKMQEIEEGGGRREDATFCSKQDRKREAVLANLNPKPRTPFQLYSVTSELNKFCCIFYFLSSGADP